jgi:hypothetical protein
LGTISERRKILERLLNCVPARSAWYRRLLHQVEAKEISVGVHLAIFVEPYLTAVLEGKKTIESRFAVTRRPPYHCVDVDDYILLKQSGGPVIGLALARATHFYQLSPTVIAELRRRFSRQLFAQDDMFWSQRAEKNYATLIELDAAIEINPLSIDKRDRQGWVTYDRAQRTAPQFHF